MTYDEALDFILQRQSLGIKPGLSRIKKALAVMGNPQDKIKIIHIAGTNGKGTVAHTIASALRSNGLRVGLFTSPWVLDYREQIMIDGDPISQSRFADFVSRVFCDSAVGTDLTEFELLTLMMYCVFADESVDYAVVECGMGGRGDATNVERSNVCSVLTSISLDHTAFLGNTIDDIVAEKEGIIRSGSPCFRYVDTGDIDRDDLALAQRVVAYLGYDGNIDLVKPPARQQRIGDILIDGGHNPDAGRALAPLIGDEVAVIGMMRDKDIDGYLSSVAPHCKRIICTDVSGPRAISAAELAGYASAYCDDVVVVPDSTAAVRSDGVSLICGSFYLLRDVINLI